MIALISLYYSWKINSRSNTKIQLIGIIVLQKSKSDFTVKTGDLLEGIGFSSFGEHLFYPAWPSTYYLYYDSNHDQTGNGYEKYIDTKRTDGEHRVGARGHCHQIRWIIWLEELVYDGLLMVVDCH